jgi:hypothetical protein
MSNIHFGHALSLVVMVAPGARRRQRDYSAGLLAPAVGKATTLKTLARR